MSGLTLGLPLVSDTTADMTITELTPSFSLRKLFKGLLSRCVCVCVCVCVCTPFRTCVGIFLNMSVQVQPSLRKRLCKGSQVLVLRDPCLLFLHSEVAVQGIHIEMSRISRSFLCRQPEQSHWTALDPCQCFNCRKGRCFTLWTFKPHSLCTWDATWSWL